MRCAFSAPIADPVFFLSATSRRGPDSPLREGTLKKIMVRMPSASVAVLVRARRVVRQRCRSGKRVILVGACMHRRHEGRNIPIELLRTAVGIADLGSYTRAARELGLSQPSVSSHVKRLQRIVSGEVFDLSSGSPRLTDYGEVIIEHARRVLSNNDQLLSVANVKPYNKDQIVLGLHNSIATSILSGLFAEFVADKHNEVTFRNLGSAFLLKGLEGGMSILLS
jgi:molybdenum-dependent DNA-binding transcriptional regulator ModE